MDKLYSLGKIILKKLEDSGYEAYFVGGFVRDYLLGRESSDIDITTNALPEKVEELFKKTVATGKKYGTVTVFIEGNPFEVTTYRIDQNYLNHRKPESVSYSKKLEEDLKRRDFTINALAMDILDQVIDLFNGQTDLNDKIIRSIGNPDERFDEDALRIIRALRFVSKLGFEIENTTLESMKKNIDKIVHLPNERIVPELEELFLNPFNKPAIEYMQYINFHKVFPELSEGLEKYSISKVNLDMVSFFALSLYLRGEEIPDYWRFSNKDKMMIYRLIHILKATKKTHFNPDLVYKVGIDTCLKANKIAQVINKSNNQEELIIHIYKSLPIKKRDELKINGHDILKIQPIDNEEIIGEILEELEFQVINDRLENDFEILKAYAKKLVDRLDG